jgi:hypothetical protein
MASYLAHHLPLLWAAMAFVSAIIVFVGVHIIWRIRADDIKSAAELRRRLSAGRPVVVELYTNL